jgi:hypothetical protein
LVVSFVFPGSPTVTHWIVTAFVMDPNGTQVSVASPRQRAFNEKRIMIDLRVHTKAEKPSRAASVVSPHREP